MSTIRIDAKNAYIVAGRKALPFAPSRAAVEQELQPIVDRMKAMTSDERKAYAAGSVAGSWAAVAVEMFKQQVTQ